MNKRIFFIRRKVFYLTLIWISLLILLFGPYIQNEVIYIESDNGNYMENNTELNYKNNFIVFTPGCKIPYFDPFDPSLSKITNVTKWVNCEEVYPPLIDVHNYTLSINKKVQATKFENFSYCNSIPIYRDKEGYSDNKYKYDWHNSKPFNNSAYIYEEFNKVECYSQNKNKTSLLYENFYSFIIKKNKVEKMKIPLATKYKSLYKEQMNVVLLVLDSMSRLNFIRKLPKTYSYLINLMKGMEYKGFNKVADSTFPCMIPFLTGNYVQELCQDKTKAKQPFDKYNIVWKNFSAQGYRTLLGEDPGSVLFPYFMSGFNFQPTDYYFNPMNKAIHASKWAKRSKHFCLDTKLDFEYTLNWLFDYIDVFKNKPYFAYVHLSNILHDYIEYFSNIDKPLLNFFTQLHNKQLLNNTVFFLFGDHGLRFGKMRNTLTGRFEERLPLFFILTPSWFHVKYPNHFENLKFNADKLTTAFDAYETLIDILKFDGKIKPVNQSSRGISLFQKIPGSRTCESATILPHWCTCQEITSISTLDETAIKAAKFSVDKINELLSASKNQCASLNFVTLLSALVTKVSDKILGYSNTKTVDFKNERTFSFKNVTSSTKDYFLTFLTSPNNATFESTIQYEEQKKAFTLTTEISRTNKYGQQSHCITDAILRKYCFCLDKL